MKALGFCVDALHPIQQFFSHGGTPGLTITKLHLKHKIKCLAQQCVSNQ